MKSRREFLKKAAFATGIWLGLPPSLTFASERLNHGMDVKPDQDHIPTISITTIIEILNVDRYYDTGEIFVDCLAFDGCSDVFELRFLTGFTEKASENLEIGPLYQLHGKYISLCTDVPYIYHVELEPFNPKPTDLFKDEDEVRERFKKYKTEKAKENIIPF